MARSILNGKRILAVDDEPDILDVLEEEILDAAPKCKFEKATTYYEATRRLTSQTYDVVILDIMGIRRLDLLDLSAKRNLTVAMFTAHALIPDSVVRFIEMKARAGLPKDKLGEIVPFLESVLEKEHLPGRGHLMKKLEGYFNFRWGSSWKKLKGKFWKESNEEVRTNGERRNLYGRIHSQSQGDFSCR